jgi:LuxR family maltose regulon positive regulatory protein
VEQAQGDFAAARQLLQHAAQIAARFDAMEIDDISVAIDQAQLALAEGKVDEAVRWAQGRGLDLSSEIPDRDAWGMQASFLDSYYHEAECAILARICLAESQSEPRGCLSRASALLEQLQRRAEAQGHGRRTVQTLILRALVHQALGGADAAAQTLDRALSLARPEGYVRVFLDEGERLVPLLREAVLHGTEPRYARTLLEAMGMEIDLRARPGFRSETSLRNADQPLIEPLSKRELEVLRFLTTSLSSSEIAGQLYVSVNTVRSHIRHIYGKLDAHSRIEAIARAQELQLI